MANFDNIIKEGFIHVRYTHEGINYEIMSTRPHSFFFVNGEYCSEIDVMLSAIDEDSAGSFYARRVLHYLVFFRRASN